MSACSEGHNTPAVHHRSRISLALRPGYGATGLRRIALASRSIGIGAVMVHAKDGTAKQFYLRCAEFIEYPEDSRTLFLPIETVVAAFSQEGGETGEAKRS